MKKPCKACAAKLAGHKKHAGKRIGGPSSHGWGEQTMMTFSTGGGMIAAHEIKGLLPESLRTSLGANADYVINGAGAVLGVVAPVMLTEAGTDAHRYASAVGSGFAGQCLYALYAKFRAGADGTPTIKGWDNRAYALAGIDNGSYALAAPKRGMNGAMPNPQAYAPKVNATVPKPQAYAAAGYGA